MNTFTVLKFLTEVVGLVFAIIVFVIAKKSFIATRIYAGLVLDKANSERFHIDNRLQTGEISQEEAKSEIDGLNKKIDYHSENLDFASRILFFAKIQVVVMAIVLVVSVL